MSIKSNILILLTISFLIISLSGCTYVSEQRKKNFTKKFCDAETKIIKGKTTKKDVLTLLGDTGCNKDFYEWVYYVGYSEMTAWNWRRS